MRRSQAKNKSKASLVVTSARIQWPVQARATRETWLHHRWTLILIQRGDKRNSYPSMILQVKEMVSSLLSDKVPYQILNRIQFFLIKLRRDFNPRRILIETKTQYSQERMRVVRQRNGQEMRGVRK